MAHSAPAAAELYRWATARPMAGLRELAEFRRVKTIIITDTQVTDAGVKQLKDMWPEVKVVR